MAKSKEIKKSFDLKLLKKKPWWCIKTEAVLLFWYIMEYDILTYSSTDQPQVYYCNYWDRKNNLKHQFWFQWYFKLYVLHMGQCTSITLLVLNSSTRCTTHISWDTVRLIFTRSMDNIFWNSQVCGKTYETGYTAKTFSTTCSRVAAEMDARVCLSCIKTLDLQLVLYDSFL